MAKAAYFQRGEALDYTNGTGSDIDAGTVIVLGTKAKIAVAGCDIPAGATGSVFVEGVFEFPEKPGESAIAQGAPVYWDGSGITATSSSNTPAGYAAAPSGASATKIFVKINA